MVQFHFILTLRVLLKNNKNIFYFIKITRIGGVPPFEDNGCPRGRLVVGLEGAELVTALLLPAANGPRVVGGVTGVVGVVVVVKLEPPEAFSVDPPTQQCFKP